MVNRRRSQGSPTEFKTGQDSPSLHGSGRTGEKEKQLYVRRLFVVIIQLYLII